MLQYVSELRTFLWLNNIPLYVYTVCLSIDGHLGFFYLWLFWIMLQWIVASKYLFESLLSIPLGIYLEVEFLDHMVISVFNLLRNGQTVFHHDLHHFTFPPTAYKGFGFSTLMPTLVISLFLLVIALISGTLLTTFPSAWLTPTGVSVLSSDVNFWQAFPQSSVSYLLS